MYYKVQFDSGLAACMHSVITFFSFFAEIHHFVVFRRDSNSNKAFSLEEQKPNHLEMESLQHFNLLLLLLSCVCVHVVWFGFFQRSKNNRAFQPNPVFCTGSFPVRPAIGGLKSGAVVNQTKPNTSGCDSEKLCDLYLAKRFVSGDTSGVLFSCLCDTASMPSETESVNTDNNTGADDKSSCCGPLW